MLNDTTDQMERKLKTLLTHLMSLKILSTESCGKGMSEYRELLINNEFKTIQ